MFQGREVRLSDYGFSIFEIETQANCNMSCEFCSYPHREDTESRLPENVVFEAIDSVDPKDEKLDYVCFSHYNEPLLDNRIYRFIEHARNRGFRTLLKTNGLLLGSERVRRQLIDAEPTYLKISFQTLNEAFFRTRGVKLPFDKYKKNIFEFLRHSLDRNCPTEITLDFACNFISKRKKLMRRLLGLEYGDPLTPDSIHEIKENLLAFLRELRDFDPRIDFDEKKTTELLDNVVPSYLDQTGISLTDRIKLKVKHFIYLRRLTEFYPVKVGKPCGTKTLGIVSDGAVVPCCFVYDGRLVMGNVKNEPLRSIMNRNHDFISAIKESGGRSLPPVCRKCKGAPTRIGAVILSLIRHFQNRSRTPVLDD